jgi:transcriptional regulator with XRE-family HTH domain
MSDNLKEKTSKRIKELRLKYKYTMERLAEKIGTSKSTIAKWENGYVENMRQDNILKLAKTFNVPPTYIMGYDEADPEIGFVEEKTVPYNANNKQALTEREKHFIECYSKLSEEQKKLVDGLMSSWLSKQESDPVSQD